jgi:Rieske Fe-S protein
LDDRSDLPRRDVVGMILAALVASAAAGLASLSMGMRFLRPKVKPFDLTAPPDKAEVPEQVVAQRAELQNVWDNKDFIFRQVNIEYSPKGQQTVEIPGYAVRLPDQTGDPKNHYIMVYSRICPHLGCIFNFEQDPSVVARNYGGFRPDGPVFACPCHLSIYDLAQGGKVVSGPAPRPPYEFEFKIEGDNVIVTAPPGGLA